MVDKTKTEKLQQNEKRLGLTALIVIIILTHGSLIVALGTMIYFTRN